MPGINDLQIKKLFQNLKCCDNDEDIKLFNHLIFAKQALGIRGLCNRMDFVCKQEGKKKE